MVADIVRGRVCHWHALLHTLNIESALAMLTVHASRTKDKQYARQVHMLAASS
jgi:hypothetical protein